MRKEDSAWQADGTCVIVDETRNLQVVGGPNQIETAPDSNEQADIGPNSRPSQVLLRFESTSTINSHVEPIILLSKAREKHRRIKISTVKRSAALKHPRPQTFKQMTNQCLPKSLGKLQRGSTKDNKFGCLSEIKSVLHKGAGN
jgi:hypothetical protein